MSMQMSERVRDPDELETNNPQYKLYPVNFEGERHRVFSDDIGYVRKFLKRRDYRFSCKNDYEFVSASLDRALSQEDLRELKTNSVHDFDVARMITTVQEEKL